MNSSGLCIERAMKSLTSLAVDLDDQGRRRRAQPIDGIENTLQSRGRTQSPGAVPVSCLWIAFRNGSLVKMSCARSQMSLERTAQIELNMSSVKPVQYESLWRTSHATLMVARVIHDQEIRGLDRSAEATCVSESGKCRSSGLCYLMIDL